jgi:hypothetical protein
MAKKHKGQSTWSLGEPILDASKCSVVNPRLFQDPDRRIHLLYLVLKIFTPATPFPISLCKWQRIWNSKKYFF